MAENTNSRNFRNRLSDFFDKALKKPISITRGDDRFILVNEEEYLSLKDEVMSLQRNLLSVLEVRAGNSESYDNPEEHFNSLFDRIGSKVKSSSKKEAI